MPDYRQHELLVAPARRRPDAWRVVVGLVAIFLISGFLFSVLFQAFRAAGLIPFYEMSQLSAYVGTTPSSLLALLLSFSALIIGTFLVARALHDRRAVELLGPLSTAWAQFRACLVPLLVLSLGLMAVTSGLESDLTPHLPFDRWLVLLPFALVGIAIQTGGEELLFRGYLQPQLAARLDRPIVWLALPAAVFGILHYDTATLGDTAILAALWAFGFGLAAGDLTARSGTLGPAIAFHMVNNLSAMLIAALPGSYSGLALYHYGFSGTDSAEMTPYMIVDLAFILVAWLTCRLAIRR